MIKRNQLGVVQNAFQGRHRRVLTVCSAGCLRSPTAAHILSGPPWNFNTRCVGTSEEYAIILVTEALVIWADVILVMDSFQQHHINMMQNKLAEEMTDYNYKQVINLEIEDEYSYRDPKLVEIMTEKFNELFTSSGEVLR